MTSGDTKNEVGHSPGASTSTGWELILDNTVPEQTVREGAPKIVANMDMQGMAERFHTIELWAHDGSLTTYVDQEVEEPVQVFHDIQLWAHDAPRQDPRRRVKFEPVDETLPESNVHSTNVAIEPR